MLEKSAAHVEGCSRRTLFAAMTPSCVFSASGAMGVVMSSPFVSFTPTDPVTKAIGALTFSVLMASKTYCSGTTGGFGGAFWPPASMPRPSRTAPATSEPPTLIRRPPRDVMQRGGGLSRSDTERTAGVMFDPKGRTGIWQPPPYSGTKRGKLPRRESECLLCRRGDDPKGQPTAWPLCWHGGCEHRGTWGEKSAAMCRFGRGDERLLTTS